MQHQQPVTEQQPLHMSDTQWGKIARPYKTITGGDLSMRHAAEALRRLELNRDDRIILDIAGGAGAFSLQAAEALKRVHSGGQQVEFKVLATDFAQAMVETCAKEAKQQGLTDVVECRQLDAQRLDGIADGSVDAIGCVFGVMFFPDPVGAIKYTSSITLDVKNATGANDECINREMHRVLRPGGRAAIVVWQKVATMRLFERLADRMSAGADVLEKTKALGYKFGNPEVLKRDLIAGGFSTIKSIEMYESEWSGLGADPDTINFILDMPPARPCYTAENREHAALAMKQILEEPEFQVPLWENKSLIAVVQK